MTMRSTPQLDLPAPMDRHLVVAEIAAVAMAAITLAALVFSGVRVADNPSFVPAVGCMTLLSDLLTAILLLSNAMVLKDRDPLRLGAAYLFSCLLLAAHLATFPGGLSTGPLIGSSEGSAWLWCFWQGGFPVLVLGFVFGRSSPLRSRDIPLAIAATAGTALLLTIVATAGSDWLPSLVQDDRYNEFMRFGVGPLLFVLSVVALGAVLFRRRMRDAVSIWLSLAMLASSLNMVLVLAGGERFSLGWCAARLLNLVVGVAVLVALLSNFIDQAQRAQVMNNRLKDLIATDPLTGIGNRLALDREMLLEWKRARREQTPLSLIMIDIDLFKSFNDRYGHPAGDRCIAAVGATLAQQAKRPADVAARLGGEEFVVLLPNTEEAGASRVADRVLAAISALNLPHADNPVGHVTVSIGVATCRPFDPNGNVGQFMEVADQALYRAKSAGRNQVCQSVAVLDAPARIC
ncbi:GGDEF domain-containing protein [Lichenicola sp.]|uniref:sensor domain-containing diguanylate cyclase n=1 Tax=Lichenicola sp. TaxID=2804529 RepID=UPI003B0100D2